MWSSKIDSPSGKYSALTQTDNTDTIGNVEYTIVRIKETGSWHRVKVLLSFDGGIDNAEDFQLKWGSDSHIDIFERGYGPAPVPYRVIDQKSPVTFSVQYFQKPYQPIR